MTPFLQNVARQYLRRYPDLSDFRFVFPNKRSGTFFLNYLRREVDAVRVAPEITTIDELVSSLSDAVVDSRIDLLFTLYGCYRDLRSAGKRTPDFDDEFERFAGWGEAVIRDFSEADMYGVDASALFTNVRDYRNIRTSFLTDEQLAVLEEYFGVVSLEENVERFWQNYDYKSQRKGDKRRTTEVKNRFSSLWQLLGPLYTLFNERLAERGLTYTGGAYRMALEKIIDRGAEAVGGRKTVFVGFNVLSKIEWLIFNELGKLKATTCAGEEPLADFLWDITGPMLSDPSSSGARFVSRNLKSFPHPGWLDLSESTSSSLPDVLELSASPSNVFQAKIAGDIVAELAHDTPSEEFEKAKAAIVLPDENLLLNLLYSLPESIRTPNLTMGYPLRLTSTLSFIDRVKRLHTHLTRLNGEPAFFHEDVTLLLAHPFARVIIGERDLLAIRSRITRYRLFALTPATIIADAPDSAPIFTLLPPDAAPADAIKYLDNLLLTLRKALETADSGLIDFRLDSSHIDFYRSALRRLAAAIGRHRITMKPTTLFSLADRLLAGETVRFEGEPLQGLQIMGLLETRALDFDYLVIPSMNDRIFPRRQRRRTFIPESIRRGFGMPSSGYEESIFAYYFYRLLSRAKKVYLIYDARGGDGHGGDVSRYVLQLKYLHARELMASRQYRFTLANASADELSIERNDWVRQQLKDFTTPGGKRLSASSLAKYCKCPLQFFFSSIMGIPDEPEPQEFMDPLTIGNIFHATVEDLYLRGDEQSRHQMLPHPYTFSRSELLEMKADRERILKLLTYHTNINHFHIAPDDPKAHEPLTGQPLMIAEMLVRSVEKTLDFDASIAPVTIEGLEIGRVMRVPVPGIEGLVNMNFTIDRLDTATIGGERVRRIVDYKTGTAHTQARTFDDVFSGERSAANILQPLLYAHLLNYSLCGQLSGSLTGDLRPEIYNVDKLSTPDDNLLRIAADRAESETDGETKDSAARARFDKIKSHKEVEDEFLPRLYVLIRRILCSDEPFTQTSDRDNCTFCPYKSICRR